MAGDARRVPAGERAVPDDRGGDRRVGPPGSADARVRGGGVAPAGAGELHDKLHNDDHWSREPFLITRSIYCLFDRDYHTDGEIKVRCEDAKKRGVQLHIWERKEIENYFLVPMVIQRLISLRITKNVAAPTTELITDQIEQFVLTHKDEITDALANELYVNDKASGLVVANKKARQRVDGCWPIQDKRWSLVSGKAIISQLSGRSQNAYGVSFNAENLAQETKKNEIASELSDVICAIEHGSPFP